MSDAMIDAYLDALKAALKGCTVREVDDPRAELGWGDYEAAGKELLR